MVLIVVGVGLDVVIWCCGSFCWDFVGYCVLDWIVWFVCIG